MSRGLLSVWAPPSPRALLPRRRTGALPFPLEEPGCGLYAWGRDGLRDALERADLQPGDEVILPAYHHGSEVAAVAACGLVPRFYEATPSLEPDLDELEGILSPRTRALYLIHLLGLSLDAASWRRWCDDRNLLLIEDAAMSLLSRRDGEPLGSQGDIAFFSLWKTHGLPDGGAAIMRGAQLQGPPPVRRPPLAGLARSYARWVAQRSGYLGRARAQKNRTWDPDADFVSRPLERGPSRLSLTLFSRTDSASIPAIRREHRSALLERLGDRVPEPFARPDPEACPFGVPVHSADPAGLVAHLAQRQIAATWMWSVPHPLLPAEDYPAAAARRRSTVLLPVHQGLDAEDIDRIVRAVAEFDDRNEETMTTKEIAPDFSLPDQDGNEVALDSFRGSRVVLYFYPQADTPGCTTQACGIRDHQADLAARGAVAVGISPDAPESLKAFSGRYGLPFTLLADEDGAVAREYGAWKRSRRPPFRTETLRSTFLIGPDGSLERRFERVDPATHDQLILDALDEVGAGPASA